MKDYEIFGIMQDADLTGYSFLNNPVIPDRVKEDFKAGKDTNIVFEYDFSKLDGCYVSDYHYTSKWIKLLGYPIYNADGSYDRYIITVDDVTETIKHNNEVEVLRQDISLAVDAGGLTVWGFDIEIKMFYDVHGKLMAKNPTVYSDMIKQVHPEDQAKIVNILEKLSVGEMERATSNHRFLSYLTGQYEYIKSEMMVLRDKDGSCKRIIGTHRNVTHNVRQQKEMEAMKNELQIKNNELIANQRNMELSLTSGQIDLWSYDFVEDKFHMIYGTPIVGAGMSFADFVELYPPETAKMLNKVWKKVRNNEQSHATFVLQAQDNNKKPQYDKIDMTVIKDEAGIPTSMVGTRRNITKEYLAQKYIELGNVRTRMAFDASGLEYWTFDARKRQFMRMSVDNTIERVETSEFMVSCINPQDMNGEFRKARDILRNRKNEKFRLEVRMCTPKDDGWRNYVITAVPLEIDSEGKVLTYSGIRHDTTSLVRLRNELSQRNAQIELSLVAGLILPLSIDPLTGTVLLPVNNAVANQMLKTSAHKMSINSFANRISDNGGAAIIRNINRLFYGEAMQIHEETSFIDSSGKTVSADLTFLGTNYDKRGCPSVVVGLIQNVSQQKKMLADLENAREQAEQSNKLKSAFLANMSHEIRTPLNAIVGFSELLSESEDPAERNEYCKIIQTNNELLLRLIGDILDLSKIEAGMVELKPVTFDLAKSFEESYKAMRNKCTNPDIEFRSENPYNKCIVTLDKNRLIQVWTNYVTNAIKYTPSGSITMGYRHERGELYVYVTDTGIGVAEDRRDKVFKRFQKLDDFAQGTGLGLSIVKAIVEQNGGRVGFDSKEGEGSTFYAYIPCDAETSIKRDTDKNTEPNARKGEDGKDSVEGLHILFVDDSDSNYVLVRQILKGNEIVRAKTGVDALERMKSDTFDIVLMDTKMPVMGGVEATYRIRESNTVVPIIALTVGRLSSERDDAMNAGSTDVLPKPLNRASLIKMISMYVNK